MTFGQRKGQDGAHGQAADNRLLSVGGQPEQFLFGARQPVAPAGLEQRRLVYAVAPQHRRFDRIAIAPQMPRHGLQLGGGASQAVQQQHRRKALRAGLGDGRGHAR